MMERKELLDFDCQQGACKIKYDSSGDRWHFQSLCEHSLDIIRNGKLHDMTQTYVFGLYHILVFVIASTLVPLYLDWSCYMYYSLSLSLSIYIYIYCTCM
ncbi:hypothetical protein F2P56_028121, partial [Juglans regia]